MTLPLNHDSEYTKLILEQFPVVCPLCKAHLTRHQLPRHLSQHVEYQTQGENQ